MKAKSHTGFTVVVILVLIYLGSFLLFRALAIQEAKANGGSPYTFVGMRDDDSHATFELRRNMNNWLYCIYYPLHRMEYQLGSDWHPAVY